jgi:hypothetical protein
VFERYTEKARRTVFFARYEASQLGSSEITSEHLLLGLLRDDKAVLRHLLLKIDYESVRNEIVARVQPGDLKLPLNVDLPLAEDAKLVLKFAMEEADRLNMRHIGTEHLLLGMLRDADFASAKMLAKLGADLESLQKKTAEMRERFAVHENVARYSQRPVIRPSTLEIRGKRFAVDSIQTTVVLLRQHPFYWERKPWQARDVVYEKNGKRFSFDATLAQDSEKFLLVKGGWKKDHCAVCSWEVFETDDSSHGIGYSNGVLWLCEECYQRFIAGDFFSSAYADIT